MASPLKEYIKNLLSLGKTEQEIKNVLLSAGWKDNAADEAIAEVSVEGIIVAYPPPKPPSLMQHSMVEIFINLFSFLLMGAVAGAFGALFFQIINRYIADARDIATAAAGVFSPAAIHYAIAAILVAFPLYLWTLSFWFKRFTDDPEKSESRLSKWLTYIVLLIAAGTIIGDLITVIFNFLQGDFTLRFVLKALTILVIAGFIFGFYYLERRKIQYKKEVASVFFRGLAWAASAIVACGIIIGFFAGGSPSQAKLRQLDLNTIFNLQRISSAINNYAASQSQLPADLPTLQANPSYSGEFYGIPQETLNSYSYRIVSDTRYELCASFNLSTVDEPVSDQYYSSDPNWGRHDAGYVCRSLNANLRDSRSPFSAPLKPVPQ